MNNFSIQWIQDASILPTKLETLLSSFESDRIELFGDNRFMFDVVRVLMGAQEPKLLRAFLEKLEAKDELSLSSRNEIRVLAGCLVHAGLQVDKLSIVVALAIVNAGFLRRASDPFLLALIERLDHYIQSRSLAARVCSPEDFEDAESFLKAKLRIAEQENSLVWWLFEDVPSLNKDLEFRALQVADFLITNEETLSDLVRLRGLLRYKLRRISPRVEKKKIEPRLFIERGRQFVTDPLRNDLLDLCPIHRGFMDGADSHSGIYADKIDLENLLIAYIREGVFLKMAK